MKITGPEFPGTGKRWNPGKSGERSHGQRDDPGRKVSLQLNFMWTLPSLDN